LPAENWQPVHGADGADALSGIGQQWPPFELVAGWNRPVASYEHLMPARIHFFLDFLLQGRQSLKAMKESDDGKKLILEFWKLTISSQIGMLDAMANALDNFPKDMQGSCLREMYKANAAFMTLYFRAIEQVGDQLVHMQSDALRRSSEALRTVLSKMEQADASPKPEAKAS
jgi:hypothetical protein